MTAGEAGATGTIRSTRRGATSALAVRVAGVGAGFLLQVVLARWMGADEYGRYVLVLTLAVVAGTLAALGFPTAMMRWLPQYVEEGDGARARGLLRCARLLAWAASLTAAAGTALALLVVPALARSPYAEVLWLGLLLVPLVALAQIETGVLKALRRVLAALAPDSLLRPLVIGLSVAALLALDLEVTARRAILCVAAALVLVVSVQRALALRALPARLRTAAPRYDLGVWWSVAAPLFLVAGFALLLRRTDLVMIGLLLDPSSVGVYAAASRVAELVGFFLVAVTVAAPPVIAALYHQRRTDELQQLLSGLSLRVFLPALAVGAALVLWGGLVLALFGNEFAAGSTSLAILVTGHLLSAAAGPVGFLLSMTGSQATVARVYGVTVVINGGLDLALIPRFGIEGAALATALSVAVWNGWLYAAALRSTGLDPSILGRLRRPT